MASRRDAISISVDFSLRDLHIQQMMSFFRWEQGGFHDSAVP